MASKSYLFTISYRIFSVVILFNYQPLFPWWDQISQFYSYHGNHGCILHTWGVPDTDSNMSESVEPCHRTWIVIDHAFSCILKMISKPSHVLEPNCIHTVLLQFTNGTTPSTTPVLHPHKCIRKNMSGTMSVFVLVAQSWGVSFND